MPELRITRRGVLEAGAAGTLGVLLAPQAVFADETTSVELLRWDLVDPSEGVVTAGGTDVARDAGGDMVSLTGSGQAEPEEGRAAGGGTFRHTHADGTEVAHGKYFVTGFNSFVNAGGTLAGLGLTDGIGQINQTAAGILSVNVRLVATSGATVDAVLEVHCNLPGSTQAVTEGVRLSAGSLHFVQVEGGGFTLFHILEA